MSSQRLLTVHDSGDFAVLPPPQTLLEVVEDLLEECPELMPAMPVEKGAQIKRRRARYVCDLLRSAGYTAENVGYPNVLWAMERMALQVHMAWAAGDIGPGLANHPSQSTRKDLDVRYATAKTAHMVEIGKQLRLVDAAFLED